MNKGELVAAIATKSGLSRGDAAKAVDSTFEAITEALSSGQDVKVVGFGSFVLVDRAAGEARNPRTGEKVSVAAARTPKFRAGAQLKQAVNGREPG